MEGPATDFRAMEEQLNELHSQLVTGGDASLIALEAMHLAQQFARLAAVTTDGTDSSGDLQTLQREIFRLSITDPLSGALTRQRFMQDGMLEMQHFQHNAQPFSIIQVDIVGFDAITEEHGLIAGDRILRAIVELARAQLRKQDLLGRIADWSFGILVTNAASTQAAMAARRIGCAISELEISAILPKGQLKAFSGVAEARSCHKNFFDVLRAAKEAADQAQALMLDQPYISITLNHAA